MTAIEECTAFHELQLCKVRMLWESVTFKMQGLKMCSNNAIKLAALKTIFLALLAIFCLSSAPVMATPGGVDSSGCHGSKKIGQHCHPQRAGTTAGADGSRADRVKRLKAECKGGVNAGACSGLTGKR